MNTPLPPCPKSRRRLTILLGFCIWVCGIAVGVGGVLLYPEPEEVQTTRAGRTRRGPEDIARYLREEYNLTDEEVEGVRVIYEETFTKLRELRRSIQPDMDTVYREHAEHMRELLGEERYARWHADIERKRMRVGQGRLRSTERRMRSRSRSQSQAEGDCTEGDGEAPESDAATDDTATPVADSAGDDTASPEADSGLDDSGSSEGESAPDESPAAEAHESEDDPTPGNHTPQDADHDNTPDGEDGA